MAQKVLKYVQEYHYFQTLCDKLSQYRKYIYLMFSKLYKDNTGMFYKDKLHLSEWEIACFRKDCNIHCKHFLMIQVFKCHIELGKLWSTWPGRIIGKKYIFYINYDLKKTCISSKTFFESKPTCCHKGVVMQFICLH